MFPGELHLTIVPPRKEPSRGTRSQSVFFRMAVLKGSHGATTPWVPPCLEELLQYGASGCVHLASSVMESVCCKSKSANTWTTQIGRSFCLFGKRRLFAVGGVFSFPGSVFSNSSSVQNSSRKSAEFGGQSAEFGGNSAEFRGSRFQHVGVFVAFRRFFLAGGVFGALRRKFLPPGPFGRKFCRRRVQVCIPRPPFSSPPTPTIFQPPTLPTSERILFSTGEFKTYGYYRHWSKKAVPLAQTRKRLVVTPDFSQTPFWLEF